jgi:hypothetical protein
MTGGLNMMSFARAGFLFAALAIAITASASISLAGDTSTTVRFRSGADSAGYSGRIKGDDTARFFIDARRGQKMSVTLSADNPQAYFNVLPSGSQEAIFIGSTSGNRYSGNLPQSGRYVVEVYLMRAAARRNESSSFSIDIAIPASGASSVPADDFADGDAGGPDNWVVTGVPSGDRLTVGTGPSANADTAGRLRNGEVVRNLGCRTVGASRWCRISARGEGGVHGWTNGRFLSESSGPVYSQEALDDGEMHSAKCKEHSRDCIRKAENVCNGDFRTLHSESHAGGLLKDTLPGPVTWYYLEYECGYSDGRMPKFPFRGAHYDQEYELNVDITRDFNDSRAENQKAMRESCKTAAALAFGQRAKHVLVLPVERNGGGFAVYGQYPDEGVNVTTFACTFNRAGIFKHVRRT